MKRCTHGYPLSAGIGCPAPRILPGRTAGQVYVPFPRTFLQNRSHKQVRSEQIGVLHMPGIIILRESKEQRSHDRRSGLMCHAHDFTHIRPHALPQEHIPGKNLLHVRSKTPHLVRGTTGNLENSVYILRVCFVRIIPWLAFAMHAEDRTEAGPGKPAHQQFMERRITRHSSQESADIACPPGNPRNAHGKTCLQLFPESTPCG